MEEKVVSIFYGTPCIYKSTCLTWIHVTFWRDWLNFPWLFSHDSKVRNLNLNLKCAFWIKIQKTVFWTVCMPNHIAIRNLKCAIQMMVRTVIWIANIKLRFAMWFGVHTVQNTVIQIIIWIAHFKLRIAMWFWRTHGPNHRLWNFDSKCAFRIKIKITHFAVVWKQSKMSWMSFCWFPCIKRFGSSGSRDLWPLVPGENILPQFSKKIQSNCVALHSSGEGGSVGKLCCPELFRNVFFERPSPICSSLIIFPHSIIKNLVDPEEEIHNYKFL